MNRVTWAVVVVGAHAAGIVGASIVWAADRALDVVFGKAEVMPPYRPTSAPMCPMCGPCCRCT